MPGKAGIEASEYNQAEAIQAGQEKRIAVGSQTGIVNIKISVVKDSVSVTPVPAPVRACLVEYLPTGLTLI
jgi:hypothetical protein